MKWVRAAPPAAEEEMRKGPSRMTSIDLSSRRERGRGSEDNSSASSFRYGLPSYRHFGIRMQLFMYFSYYVC